MFALSFKSQPPGTANKHPPGTAEQHSGLSGYFLNSSTQKSQGLKFVLKTIIRGVSEHSCDLEEEVGEHLWRGAVHGSELKTAKQAELSERGRTVELGSGMREILCVGAEALTVNPGGRSKPTASGLQQPLILHHKALQT